MGYNIATLLNYTNSLSVIADDTLLGAGISNPLTSPQFGRWSAALLKSYIEGYFLTLDTYLSQRLLSGYYFGGGTLQVGQCICEAAGDSLPAPPAIMIQPAIGATSPIMGVLITQVGTGGTTTFLQSGNVVLPILESTTVSSGTPILCEPTTGMLNITNGFQVGICTKTSAGDGINPTNVFIRFAPTEYANLLTNLPVAENRVIPSMTVIQALGCLQNQFDSLLGVKDLRTTGYLTFTDAELSQSGGSILLASPGAGQRLCAMRVKVVLLSLTTPSVTTLNIGVNIAGTVDSSLINMPLSAVGKYTDDDDTVIEGAAFGSLSYFPENTAISLQIPSLVSGAIKIKLDYLILTA